ncbi:MAG: HAD-IIA family hydrolase [Bacteroidales bacterium]|nr:HAD-IIA family hydrolase [Bacteroidales bacterium]
MDKSLKEKLRRIRHVALDMDGTIYLSDTIFPFTLDFLAKLTRLGISYSFLTNNPTRSLEDYLAKLHKMGIEAGTEQMYSTVPATIDYIKANLPSARRLFLLGTPSMIRQFEDAGFESTADSADDRPDAVVVAFDTTLVYSRLCRAAWWVSEGLPYIATNPDRVCPTDQPTILVDCGSLCACVAEATGRRPDAVIGKPDPAMIRGIEHRYGLKADEIAMVGDRIYTDVECAYNAGAFGVLVLSGETTLEMAREWPHAPSLICRDIAELGDLLEEANTHLPAEMA